LPLLVTAHVDNPQIGTAPILHDVHEFADEDDLLAVRGELWVRGKFELENVERLESVVIGLVRTD
jgi:hypothetical protein